MAAIGIDLGTCYSCVSVLNDGKVEIIQNEHGNRITPSYVAFVNGQRLVGDDARVQVNINPSQTVFDAKRLIGRKFNDPMIQKDVKLWPFKVVNRNGNPIIEILVDGTKKRFQPEEISSMILAKMKQTAEVYLGKEVKKAVITVPAYFNDSQRQATKDAGKIAGLDVLRVFSEPVAAAVAFGLSKESDKPRNIVVYDLGGGTFDVAVMTILKRKFTVRAKCGDTHLGGEDFDQRLLDYFLEEFQQYDKNIITSQRAVRRLRTACEKAKRALSSSLQTSIALDSLFRDIDFYTSITRACFEDLCDDLFTSTIKHVKDCLISAKLRVEDIDDIVLVGGSTRIPKIQTLLQDFFNGKQLNRAIHPDEAVSYGAAILAARLSGDKSALSQTVMLEDVTPLSLGIRTVGGIMSTVVERNSTFPLKQTRTFYNSADNEPCLDFGVFEGERTMVTDNNKLGEFKLSGLPKGPAGSISVDVTFEIDVNGILHVSAREKTTGKQKKIAIINDKGRLSNKDIQRMLSDANRYRAQDEAQRKKVLARNTLQRYCYNMKKVAHNHTMVMDEISRTLQWLNIHGNATEHEVMNKQHDLERACNPIFNHKF